MDEGASFDVMLWLPLRRRNGGVGRWFLVGMHREEADGLRQFLAVSDEFRHPDTIVVLLRSTPDRATGRFHDRVLRARGRAPAIDRRDVEWLDSLARRALAERFGGRPQREAHDPPLRLPPVRARTNGPSALLYGAVAAGLVAATAAAVAWLQR